MTLIDLAIALKVAPAHLAHIYGAGESHGRNVTHRAAAKPLPQRRHLLAGARFPQTEGHRL